MPQCEHAKVGAVEYIDRMAMNLIEGHKAVTKIKGNCRISGKRHRAWSI